MPFSGEKQGFFVLRQPKTETKTKTKKQQKQIRKFRAKWGGPLGHLTWPLNPPKKNKKKQNNKKQKQKKK